MTKKKQSIIDKIKKLFALAGNNPNEHERDVAMKRAQEMMEQHDLQALDLEDSKEEAVFMTSAFPTVAWKGRLLIGIAKLNHVYVNVVGERRISMKDNEQGTIGYIGTPCHIEACKSMFDWLVECLENMATDLGLRSNRDRELFLDGVASNIQMRCNKIIAEEKKAAMSNRDPKSRENSLMVLRKNFMDDNMKVAQNQDIHQDYDDTENRRLTPQFLAGVIMGDEISLNRQIENTTKRIERKS